MEGPRKLFVEGNNDKFVIINLIKKLCPHLPADARTRTLGGVDIHDAGDVDRALKLFAEAIRSEDGIYGLVIDADAHKGMKLANRWTAIRNILAKESLTSLPNTPPRSGWVDQMPHTPRRSALGPIVGAWILPDNSNDGAMEALLRRFVPPSDPSWEFAETVAVTARESHQAPFPAYAQAKATLHTWLAWRKEAGRPYGRAIELGDLVPDHDPIARQFADWFLQLFELPTA